MMTIRRLLFIASVLQCALMALPAGVVFVVLALSADLYPVERLLVIVLSVAISVCAACNLVCLLLIKKAGASRGASLLFLAFVASLVLLLAAAVIELTRFDPVSMSILFPTSLTTIAAMALAFDRPASH